MINESLLQAVIEQIEGGLDRELLQKVLFITNDTEMAESSCCQFSDHEGGGYETTLLGVINGILPELTGKVLVMVIEDAEHDESALRPREKVEAAFRDKRVSWRIQDKWWGEKVE